jgi:hypothetical protein
LERLRIIVGGFLGLLPAGGVTWDYVQYPAGLAALGHDVYYVEDTRLWPIYQLADSSGSGCQANIEHLRCVMEGFGLEGRWVYRDEASEQCYGLSEQAMRELCRTADVFLNLSCATPIRDDYLSIPVRVLIDTDPMFTQIQCLSREAFTAGRDGMADLVKAHTHHYTFGENIGAADCRIPDCGVTWRPTRQPICLDRWDASPLSDANGDRSFTTVMNWAAGKSLQFDGESWGQKDVEFLRVISLPRAVPQASFTVAIGQTGGRSFPSEIFAENGWRIVDPHVCCPDWRSYQQFLEDSLGEFSVAKETYVKAKTGWFSCRSACYLAAGRPVVAQDTGWSRFLPSDRGLLPFVEFQDAEQALDQVCSQPEIHGRAAREIAEAFFDSRLVLGELLGGLGS